MKLSNLNLINSHLREYGFTLENSVLFNHLGSFLIQNANGRLSISLATFSPLRPHLPFLPSFHYFIPILFPKPKNLHYISHSNRIT